MIQYTTFTQVKRSFNTWLNVAETEPVFIRRRGKKGAVLINTASLTELKQEIQDLLENAYSQFELEKLELEELEQMKEPE